MIKKAGQKTSSKRPDQYMLRFPDGVRARLAKLAAANGRSMNNEIIAALEKHLQHDDKIAAMEKRLHRLSATVWELLEYLDPDGGRFSRDDFLDKEGRLLV